MVDLSGSGSAAHGCEVGEYFVVVTSAKSAPAKSVKNKAFVCILLDHDGIVDHVRAAEDPKESQHTIARDRKYCHLRQNQMRLTQAAISAATRAW
jgi:hypothetical protein